MIEKAYYLFDPKSNTLAKFIVRGASTDKAYEKLTAYLDGMNKAILKQLVDAKIPFISSLALNRYHRAK